MSEQKAKHYRAEDLIQEGGATTESLCEDLEVNEKGLASQFYYMRLRGVFPVKQEDGTFTIVSREAWDAIQDEKAANRKTVKAKNPQERLDAATKRVDKAAKAVDTSEKRNDKDPNRKNELLYKRAEIEKELAELELEEAQEAYDEAVENGTFDPDANTDAEAGEGELE